MNFIMFRKGFLSAFDPFRAGPKRTRVIGRPELNIIDGEFSEVIKGEALMHQAFKRALSDVQQAQS